MDVRNLSLSSRGASGEGRAGADRASVRAAGSGRLRELVRQALTEASGAAMTTAATAPDQQATAVLVSQDRVVLAGLDVACEAFRNATRASDPPPRRGGDRCDRRHRRRIRGLAAVPAHRRAHRLLRRSGSPAATWRQFVDAGRAHHRARHRKTTRACALENMPCAGLAANHRMRLDDGILIRK
jgi:nicotinate-nucleotide pyrophosphorylase